MLKNESRKTRIPDPHIICVYLCSHICTVRIIFIHYTCTYIQVHMYLIFLNSSVYQHKNISLGTFTTKY